MRLTVCALASVSVRLLGATPRAAAVSTRVRKGPSDEQNTAMLSASVAEYDVGDVRSLI